MRAFDVLVNLTESGDGGQHRFVKAFVHFARIQTRRPDPCDAPPLDDDFPILPPRACVDVEKAPYPQGLIGALFAERRENEILADAHFLGGVDEIIGQWIGSTGNFKLGLVHLD
jgi:hypothetical protein